MGKINNDTKTLNLDWASCDFHEALNKEIEKKLKKDETYILYPIKFRVVNKKMHYAEINKGAKERHEEYLKKEKERFALKQ